MKQELSLLFQRGRRKEGCYLLFPRGREKEEREGQGCCPLLRYQGGLAKRKGQHQPWGEEEREFCHPCQEGGWREDQKGGTRRESLLLLLPCTSLNPSLLFLLKSALPSHTQQKFTALIPPRKRKKQARGNLRNSKGTRRRKGKRERRGRRRRKEISLD
jgi:hypothetical protein